MNNDTRSLSVANRWLMERMHQLCYGTIINLHICNGEPVLKPAPVIHEAIRLDGKRRLPKTVPRHFELKDQHRRLLELIASRRNGTIAKLSIQDGLPVNLEWEEAEPQLVSQAS